MRLPKFGYARGFDHVQFLAGQELDHTSFSHVSLDPTWKAEQFTSPTMLYNDEGELIDEDSKALIVELELFLRQFQKRRTDADVMPTILDALGLFESDEKPDSGHGFPVYDWSDIHGESLLPLMRGEKQSIRDHAIAGYFGKSWSIITEDYSFVHWIAKDVQDSQILKGELNDSEKMWSCTVGAKVIVPESDELYDRRNDPFQLRNIIGEHPEKAGELLQKLKLRIGGLRVF